MESKVRTYDGEAVTIRYDVKRCIHAAECVRGLPAVFDPDRRPWIAPDAAPPEEVAAVVARCPTGALHVTQAGAPVDEPVPTPATVTVAADGPLYVRGTVDVRSPDGETLLRDVRVALCRCGLSKNKPLCDNSHLDAFHHDGTLADQAVKGDAEADGPLCVTPAADGPLLLDGPVLLHGADGTTRRGSKCALCRCGQSQHKPFCDGSHKQAGFRA